MDPMSEGEVGAFILPEGKPFSGDFCLSRRLEALPGHRPALLL